MGNYLLVLPILGGIPRKLGGRGVSLYPLISPHLLLRSLLHNKSSSLQGNICQTRIGFQITISTSIAYYNMETMG